MKTIKAIKHSALITLVLGMVVGCAAAPTGEEAPQDQAAVSQAAVTAAKNAIADAEAALKKAEAAGYAWRDTGNMIKQAKKALVDGDTATAIQLANRAKKQSENALAQKASEEARLFAAADSYTVRRGDSLWRIAGMSEIYGNPYQWPLIYKANRSQIKDADLIYPGQTFDITRNASQAEIDAAVNHARTRGAWSLGVVEDSDLAYLSR